MHVTANFKAPIHTLPAFFFKSYPELITDTSIKGGHIVKIASAHKKVFCTIQFAKTNFTTRGRRV
jgi:hypothetical protein